MTIVLPSSVYAQPAARWSLDSAVSVNRFVGENTGDRPDVVVDVTASARLGHGWIAYLRPWIRSASTDPYAVSREIYQAAVQHERQGRVATRLELGYILSPIGIGMMDMRPDSNPTISPHLSYLIPMPSFDAGAPASMPVASSYPLGAQLTASTTAWDLRTAVVSSPPNRMYVLGLSAPNPAARPVFVAGGGITPRTGLRLGMGYATGIYATRDEVAASSAGDRRSQLVTIEGDLAFGYTHLSGELARNWLDAAEGQRTATSWFVQGQQTLSPRWFAAGRYEGADAPSRLPAGAPPTLRVAEATAGYRLSPEFTVRGSVAARKTYFSPFTSRQAGVSVVWARRWR
jgi:hypothetical protein